MRASITFSAGQSNEIGRYDVPCEESLPGLGMPLEHLPKNKIERLQRIQNQAARMLKRIPRRNHITPVLKDLHWLRINERI